MRSPCPGELSQLQRADGVRSPPRRRIQCKNCVHPPDTSLFLHHKRRRTDSPPRFSAKTRRHIFPVATLAPSPGAKFRWLVPCNTSAPTLPRSVAKNMRQTVVHKGSRIRQVFIWREDVSSSTSPQRAAGSDFASSPHLVMVQGVHCEISYASLYSDRLDGRRKEKEWVCVVFDVGCCNQRRLCTRCSFTTRLLHFRMLCNMLYVSKDI